MRWKLVTDHAPARARTMVLALETGEEVVESLLAFAAEHDVRGATFSGLGAVDSCTIGFFDRARHDYDEIRIDEQLEVLSIVGNLSQFDGAPRVHAHVTLGDRHGIARGGHLLRASVWPTLELTVEIHDEALVRAVDEAVGLPLLVP